MDVSADVVVWWVWLRLASVLFAFLVMAIGVARPSTVFQVSINEWEKHLKRAYHLCR